MVPVIAPRLIARVRPIFSRLSNGKFRMMNQGHSASKTSMTPPYTTKDQLGSFGNAYQELVVPIFVPPRYSRYTQFMHAGYAGR